MFCKKLGILKNFAKFLGWQLCQIFFKNKVVVLRSATLLKKRLWHRCFPVNIGKFRKTLILKNICERLIRIHSYFLNHYNRKSREHDKSYISTKQFHENINKICFSLRIIDWSVEAIQNRTIFNITSNVILLRSTEAAVCRFSSM